MLGGYLFDGTQLFLAKRIERDGEARRTVTSQRGEKHTIVLRYTKEVCMTDAASLQVLNLILRHAMEGMKLQLVGRHFYDPDAKVSSIYLSE